MKAYLFILSLALSGQIIRSSPNELELLERLATESGPVQRRVACGMSRKEVVGAAGRPDVRVTDDVWIFSGFRPTVAVDERLDTLLVAFRGDKVMFVKLITTESLRRFIAEAENSARQQSRSGKAK